MRRTIDVGGTLKKLRGLGFDATFLDPRHILPAQRKIVRHECEGLGVEPKYLEDQPTE